MGTAVGIDVRDPLLPAPVLVAVFAALRDIEARFSTYRADSEISRLADGALAEASCSPDVRYVLALCDALARTSGGAFDARHHRQDGRLDPSGLVKGWSIDEAALLIEAAGGRDYLINAGGDVLARGEAAPGRPWRVGLRHPERADRFAAVLAVRDLAVATSGAYERGSHILDPRTGLPPRGLRSMTVVGPSLGFADAYATAAFVMGLEGLAWVAERPGYDAYAITDDRRSVWTAGIEALLVREVAGGGGVSVRDE
ncbi:MAG: FAD:protein FMN transferase [Candidatus Limnocylindrales bacterium]